MTDKGSDIVVIDDDPVFRGAVVAMLENHGHSVRAFENPLEGLESLDACSPRLLILDFSMPELSGQDVLVRIARGRNWGDMSVFIVTATDFSETGRDLLASLGAHRTYLKPIDLREFSADLQFALAPRS